VVNIFLDSKTYLSKDLSKRPLSGWIFGICTYMYFSLSGYFSPLTLVVLLGKFSNMSLIGHGWLSCLNVPLKGPSHQIVFFKKGYDRIVLVRTWAAGLIFGLLLRLLNFKETHSQRLPILFLQFLVVVCLLAVYWTVDILMAGLVAV
jgi:hypothetical protein